MVKCHRWPNGLFHLVPWVTWARNFCAHDQSHVCNVGEPGHFFLCATSHANLPLIVVCKIQTYFEIKGAFWKKILWGFRLASSACWAKPALKRLVPLINNTMLMNISTYTVYLVQLCCLMSSVDILGASWDQCWSMVQYCFKSMETIRLVRTVSPGQPPQLSHSSWTMAVFFKLIIIMKIHKKWLVHYCQKEVTCTQLLLSWSFSPDTPTIKF